MTTFTCPICSRRYETDSDRKSIVKMMGAYAAECEQSCRQLVNEKFGEASRTTFETAELYRKLT